MRRDIVGLCAHVNLLVDVDTGNDEEDSRSTSSTGEKATQAEDDCPLIFLNLAFKLIPKLTSFFNSLNIENLDNFY